MQLIFFVIELWWIMDMSLLWSGQGAFLQRLGRFRRSPVKPGRSCLNVPQHPAFSVPPSQLWNILPVPLVKLWRFFTSSPVSWPQEQNLKQYLTHIFPIYSNSLSYEKRRPKTLGYPTLRNVPFATCQRINQLWRANGKEQSCIYTL